MTRAWVVWVMVAVGCGGGGSRSGESASPAASDAGGGTDGEVPDPSGGETGEIGVLCPAHDDPDPAPRLLCTLEQLAGFGGKGAGTPGGFKAGKYVAQRFRDAGLRDVGFEEFRFPAFRLASSSLTITVGVMSTEVPHEVFAYSGIGTVDADVVYVGNGHERDYDGLNVTGRVVFVERDPLFHRSSQYRLAVEHGAAAMLYRSHSPDNLIQIGTVADPEDGLGAIPAITVGNDDGRPFVESLEAGATVHVAATVDAEIESATGRNVVGWLAGSEPSGAYLVVGAHYDTWYTGSVDNGTGVAAMIEMAEALAAAGPRRLGIAFVGYDAEELGLFGGYDFLRRHVVVADEPMLAFVNLEMPANDDPNALRALAVTRGGAIDREVDTEASKALYPIIVDFETVAGLFGGVIPTDIQGMYWSGLQGLTTVSDTPYYHTTQDTPDKVDTQFLGDAVLHLLAIVDRLDAEPETGFAAIDAAVWNAAVRTSVVDDDLQVDVTVRDATGTVRGGANVRVWLDVDDFSRVYDHTVVSDDAGRATVTIPGDVAREGSDSRWLHVTAGDEHPSAETIVPI